MAQLQQSPINLDRAIRATVPRRYLRPKWASAHGKEHQGEHGVEVVFQADPDIGMLLDGKWYTLRSYHFHVPSEHFFGGRQADGEVHVVHQNPDDGTVAVLGMLLRVDKKSAPGPEGFYKALGSHRKEKEPRGHTLPTTPADFLPPKEPGERHRVYRYQGSLTTAPFTEPVAWVVFQDLLAVSEDLIKYLDPPGPKEPQHARAVQPLHGRLVLDIAVTVSDG